MQQSSTASVSWPVVKGYLSSWASSDEDRFVSLLAPTLTENQQQIQSGQRWFSGVTLSKGDVKLDWMVEIDSRLSNETKKTGQQQSQPSNKELSVVCLGARSSFRTNASQQCLHVLELNAYNSIVGLQCFLHPVPQEVLGVVKQLVAARQTLQPQTLLPLLHQKVVLKEVNGDDKGYPLDTYAVKGAQDVCDFFWDVYCQGTTLLEVRRSVD